MKPNPFTSIIVDIMTDFASLTGLSAAGNIPRRYLWEEEGDIQL